MTETTRNDERLATLGMDLGKRSFHLIGMDARGRVIMRQKLTRGRLEQTLANFQRTS
jgi:transposase